ncbi:MAG TPA: hypothetical protein PLF61_07900 [Candidatus Goldiibacteriota bacterium]|nr:hypothetical protein [Candidatus Goldiibacteriota bacterium]
MGKKIFILVLIVFSGIAPPVFSQTNVKKELPPPYAVQGHWRDTQGHIYSYGAIDFYIVGGKVQAGVYTMSATCMPSWTKTYYDLWKSYQRIPVQYDGRHLKFQYILTMGNIFNTDPACKSDTFDLSEHTLSFNLTLISENKLSGTLTWDNKPPVIVEYVYKKDQQ